MNNEQPFIIPKMKLDLSKLPTLEYICIDDCFIENLSEARELKSVQVNCYCKENLQELSSLKKLDTLDLTRSKIKSLDGCQQMKKLQCLYLYDNRSLSDISELEGDQL
ncbi:MAG: leucine-rich repeat domain-containing protein [Lachnospiraceae bacterium]